MSDERTQEERGDRLTYVKDFFERSNLPPTPDDGSESSAEHCAISNGRWLVQEVECLRRDAAIGQKAVEAREAIRSIQSWANIDHYNALHALLTAIDAAEKEAKP